MPSCLPQLAQLPAATLECVVQSLCLQHPATGRTAGVQMSLERASLQMSSIAVEASNNVSHGASPTAHRMIWPWRDGCVYFSVYKAARRLVVCLTVCHASVLSNDTR